MYLKINQIKMKGSQAAEKVEIMVINGIGRIKKNRGIKSFNKRR